MSSESKKTILTGGLVAIIILGGFLVYLLVFKEKITTPVSTPSAKEVAPTKDRFIPPQLNSVEFINGAFFPLEIKIKAGSQVNFFNKSEKEINLFVEGLVGCNAKLKPGDSIGCSFREIKTYNFQDKISKAKGKIIAE
ncbi:MAG: hypothetical protein HYV52_01190 [Parcubacteria group bacterium]|nr:hypothetical protein [Parcubacteria group bacterium]